MYDQRTSVRQLCKIQNTEKKEDIIKYWGSKVRLQVQESEHTNIEDIIKYCQILCVQG